MVEMKAGDRNLDKYYKQKYIKCVGEKFGCAGVGGILSCKLKLATGTCRGTEQLLLVLRFRIE